MKDYIGQRALDVASAWEALYNKQGDIMKWSPELDKIAPGFIDQVEDLRPIEAVPQDKKLPEWVLNTYRDFIVEKETDSVS